MAKQETQTNMHRLLSFAGQSVLVCLLMGCSLLRPAGSLAPGPRAFDIAKDGLEKLAPPPAPVATREPLADPALRGWADAQVARQFFLHAKFEAAAQPPTTERRLALVLEVLRRDAREASDEARRVVVPGYANLREFSRLHGHLLRAESWSVCECASRAPLLSRAFGMFDGAAAVMQLNAAVAANQPLIVQLYRQHELRYQRSLLVVASREGGKSFVAYDPAAGQPVVELTYNADVGKFTVSDDSGGAVSLRVAR